MANRLVRLTTYYSVMEAKIFVSMLHAHGIYAVAPTELANNAPHMMTALGGITVWVVASDYEDALALLQEVRAAEPPPPRKSFLEAVFDGLVSLFVLIFFGVPPAPSPPPCGTEEADPSGKA